MRCRRCRFDGGVGEARRPHRLRASCWRALLQRCRRSKVWPDQQPFTDGMPSLQEVVCRKPSWCPEGLEVRSRKSTNSTWRPRPQQVAFRIEGFEDSPHQRWPSSSTARRLWATLGISAGHDYLSSYKGFQLRIDIFSYYSFVILPFFSRKNEQGTV